MANSRTSLGLWAALVLAGCAAGLAARHTVSSGENVAVLAARAGLAESEFRRINHMGPTDIVRPGDTVLLRGDGPAAPKKDPERPAPRAAPAETPKPRPALPPQPQPQERAKPQPSKKPAAPPPRAAEPSPSPKGERPSQSTPAPAPTPAAPTEVAPAPKPPAPRKPPPQPAAPEKKGAFSWPLDGEVARPFGKSAAGENLGIDVGAPVGTTVRAAAAGKVIYAGTPTQAYGPLIVIDHGGRLHTVYSNLRDLAVKRGDTVDGGHALGTVGDKAAGSSPHLHFEVRKGGDAVDPLLYLPAR